jgi:farnesyl diphosphate synthase
LGQLKHLGLTLGVAYQVLDDILEVTTASSLLGKSNASDLKNKKATAVSCLGLEKAQAWLEKLSNEILSQIASLPCYNNHLQAVVKAMLNRKY